MGPSCHAFDKILRLVRRLDTMLIAPAYQASIDTLRHSITSRIIFYTTFWFLSIPFGKIIGKLKKFSASFHTEKVILFNFGNNFILLQLIIKSYFSRYKPHYPLVLRVTNLTAFNLIQAGIYIIYIEAIPFGSYKNIHMLFLSQSLTLIIYYVIIIV